MNILISIVKAVLIRLATKYAAELVVKHSIEALKKASASTETTIDDDIVSAVEKEKQFIIDTIKGGF